MTRQAPDRAATGWIGVGKMGRPMAGRLIEAGHLVVIADPVPENRASLVARGAQVADDVGDLFGRCAVVFATIPNDAALDAVVFGDGTAPGLVSGHARPAAFVEMSTVSPHASLRAAEGLERADIAYLRAPVSGSTDMAKAGKLTVLASGDPEAWRLAEPLLSAVSARRFYLGPGEEARYMKLVLNTFVGATSAILSEAVLLGEAGGLSRAQMMEVLAESAVASPLIGYKRTAIENDDFSPAFSVEQMVKDFTLICEAGNRQHIPMFTTSFILQQYHAAVAAGHAEDDFFVLVKWLRDLSGRGAIDSPSETARDDGHVSECTAAL